VSVITISRGSFSGGKMIAEGVAQELGYRCIDRDVIVERAAAAGVSHEELERALVEPPGFLERLQHKRYLYLALIQAALAEEVREGRAVYHGHAGHLLLKGGPPVLRVRIIAPLEFRVRMARERLHISEEEALEYIRKVDEQRRKWTRYLYGVDWTDPSLYDIVINLENVSVDEAKDLVVAMARRRRCYELDERCRALLEDMAIASRVKARLALDPATAALEFDVSCKDGVVTVRGRLSRPEQAKDVERVALTTEGVKSVRLEELVSATPD